MTVATRSRDSWGVVTQWLGVSNVLGAEARNADGSSAAGARTNVR